MFDEESDEELKRKINDGLKKEFEGDLPKYLDRYIHTLSVVKHLLDLAKELLNKIKQQLDIFQHQIQKNPDFYKTETFDDSYTNQMVVALYLRQILELMLSRFIGNNDIQLEDKLDSKNGRYKKIIEQLENINSDIIKILKLSGTTNEGDQTKFIFSKSAFWTKDNLIEVYDKLSFNYLHYSHELHENSRIIHSENMNDFFQKLYKICKDNYEYLLNIYGLIFSSLQNHFSFINIGSDTNEYIFSIKDFKIDILFPKSVVEYKRIK